MILNEIVEKRRSNHVCGKFMIVLNQIVRYIYIYVYIYIYKIDNF